VKAEEKVKNRAKSVLSIEADAIRALISRIDDNFARAVELLNSCKGRVVVTGMGKPGIIGQKISATLSSLGTPSLWLHPAEAIHGDLGRVTKDDVVIAISNSGETEEITRLLPLLKKIGARLIALTGNKSSTLAKYSDVILDVSVKKEACSLGLAPTSSTTATLAMGDALAVSLLEKKSFKAQDYAFFHPGGVLGKRLLLKVEDLMRTGTFNPVVRPDALVKDALIRSTKARAGSCSVVDGSGRLKGIFTDGDLRRHLERDSALLSKKICEVMTHSPAALRRGSLAAEALKIMREKKIDELPVVDERGKVVGLLDVQDILKAGLV